MSDTFVFCIGNRCQCKMELEPCFFENAKIVTIRKLLRFLFQQPWRNEETIARLGAYLKDRMQATYWTGTTYERYAKILAYYEALKTKTTKN